MMVESNSQPPLNPTEAISATATVPPPLPPSQRRPRVREVRSRFMSPVVSSSSSSGDLHFPGTKSPLPDSHCRTQRSTSAHRRRQLDLDPPPENRPEISRSLETPFLASQSSKNATLTSHRKRREGNPLKENAGSVENIRAFRADSPMVSSSTDRIVPSRFRQTPHNPLQRSVGAGVSPATKLVHSNGMSFSGPSARVNDSTFRENLDENSTGGSDGDQGKSGELGVAKLITDVRCSIPEGDMLPSVSKRLLVERNGNCEPLPRVPVSPHWRLVNSPFLSGSVERTAPGLPKQSAITMIGGKVCLPPVPAGGKSLADVKKGRKVTGQQEDMHMLKLLHNHYLQWRFANAKAEASMRSLKAEAERILFSLCAKIRDMHTSVKRKRAELEILRRSAAVSAIVESQMPYLDEWSAIEEDYLASLSEATKALSNVALQLPMSGSVRVDVKEVRDALLISVKIMDAITSHVEKFTTKTQELEVYISELAKVACGEKVVIEECGSLLSEAYLSEVRECSLRSQIMQSQPYLSRPIL